MGRGRGARARGATLGVVLFGVALGACTTDQASAPPTTVEVTIATTAAETTSGTTASTVPAPTTTTTAATTTTAPTTTTIPAAAAAVDQLEVRPADDPSAPPYVRDLMDGGDWAYDPASGCNTRERVLIEESLVPPTVDDRCRSTGGRWRSAYDGVETGDPADLQIDHLVPLADAWRSGAWRWSPERRLAFANDLEEPATLIAVTGSTNQSKSDARPDEWLPPDRSAWCAYATDWVSVKQRWGLSVLPSEKAALVQLLAGC